MEYISIGGKCNVKYQIKKHTRHRETLFFDWLGTDMDTVILVLQCKNINEILTYDNIIKDPKPGLDSSLRISIKSLPYCVSIHDFKLDFSDKEINNFLHKYKRRYERIIEIIKSNKKLYFIRYGEIKDNHKEAFIETILKINPNCNFTLVSINIKQNTYFVNQSKYFLEINLTYNPTQVECDNDWTTSYIDWNFIFKTINELT
jgi:hypothetical protein